MEKYLTIKEAADLLGAGVGMNIETGEIKPMADLTPEEVASGKWFPVPNAKKSRAQPAINPGALTPPAPLHPDRWRFRRVAVVSADTEVPDRYIGDGVYASFDGHQIWLRTQQGAAIALDSDTYASLKDYADEVRAALDAKRGTASRASA